MAEKQSSPDPVVELLAALARDKVYGPLDMLSRVEDNDEFYMKLAREALYSAMRYASTDKQLRIPNLEEAVEMCSRRFKRYLAGLVQLCCLPRLLLSFSSMPRRW